MHIKNVERHQIKYSHDQQIYTVLFKKNSKSLCRKRGTTLQLPYELVGKYCSSHVLLIKCT